MATRSPSAGQPEHVNREVFIDLKRKTMSMSMEESKMVELQQTLDDFMVNGLQDFPGLLTFGAKREDDEECFQVEDSWRAFVDEIQLGELDQMQIDQQDAIWEIIRSEVDYIRDIRVAVDLYFRTLLNLQAAILLNEIETEKIFSNLASIEECHTRFWREKLSKMVKNARAEERLPSAVDVAKAFEGFEDLFAPYTVFCKKGGECLKYVREQVEENEMFRFFIEWAQRHPDSRSLKLQDLLEYPVWRIMEYPLLLTSLEVTTPEHDGKSQLSKRISEVEDFVRRVKPTPRCEQKKEGMAPRDGASTKLGRKTAFRVHYSSSDEPASEVAPASVEASMLLKLQQTLHDFTVNGLQDFPGLLTFSTKREDDEECFQLEETWSALADEGKISGLSREQTSQQEGIWDLLMSEVACIKSIRIIVDLYLCTLLNLQAAMLLNEIDTEKIFSNITAIDNCHTRFWKERLSNVVKNARAEKRLPSVADVAKAFEGFADYFDPYIKFCANQTMCLEYLNKQIKDNELFRFFLEWAQRQPKSGNCRIQDLVLHPVSRIDRYPVLLEGLESTTLDDQGRAEVAARVSEVKEFVTRLVHHCRQDEEAGERQEKLTDSADEPDIPVFVEESKMAELQQTLNDFLVNGLQDFPGLLTFGTTREDDEECFQIEETWHAFVTKEKLNELDKNQRDQQDAIWKIITTEVKYIKDIRIIVDLYLRTLINVQASIMLNEIETEKIFSNITAIEDCHTRFWKKRLSKVVKNAREEKRLPSAADVAKAFEGFTGVFAPYVTFCAEKDKCTKYLRERVNDNEMFKYFLEWAQRHPTNRNLPLQDLLNHPVSRILKYPVLLAAVEKRTPQSEGKSEVCTRVSEVKELVTRVTREFLLKWVKQKSEEKPTDNAGDSVNGDSPASEEIPKLDQLKQRLDEFMEDGLQDFPALLTFSVNRECDEECFRIEKTWRALVDISKLGELDQMKKEQQEAIWEIIKTEVSYIRDIRVIVDVYLCTLINLQASMLLNEIETEKIFSNITTIEECHTRFWKERLSNVVKKARAEKRLPSAADLAKAFKRFVVHFAPYTKFCRDDSKCLMYLGEQIQENEMFRFFTEWAEKHPKSRNLKLQDLLEFPAQRISTYPRLLAAVADKTPDNQIKADVSARCSEMKELVMRVSREFRPELEKQTTEETLAEDAGPALDEVPKLVQLQEMLDDLMTNGLQDFPCLLTFSTKREDDEECFEIEETWQAFAEERRLGELDSDQMDQQEAIWEIITTEISYIRDIRIIVDLYLCTLINLQASIMLNEIESEKIFSNITAIEKLQTKFWKERLSNVVKNARVEKRLPSAADVAEAFEGFSDLFMPYIKFCTDQNMCMKYLRQRIRENEMFKYFLEWAERHPSSQRFKLQDLLVYPVLRITKYPLLLTAVERKTPADQGKPEVSARILEVTDFVTRVNCNLRH